MSDFNSFYELFNKIEEDMLSVVNNELKEETEETLHGFSKDIGEMYPNKTWENRYDRNPDDESAFENRRNIVSDLYKNKNEITLETYNIAKGEMYDSDFYLDEIIESGEGYQFGTPPPRPVVGMTQEIIDIKANDIIKNGLKNRGWNIE